MGSWWSWCRWLMYHSKNIEFCPEKIYFSGLGYSIVAEQHSRNLVFGYWQIFFSYFFALLSNKFQSRVIWNIEKPQSIVRSHLNGSRSVQFSLGWKVSQIPISSRSLNWTFQISSTILWKTMKYGLLQIPENGHFGYYPHTVRH